MGKGRTTVGLVTACLIKEIQITKELRFCQKAIPQIFFFLAPPNMIDNI